MHHTPWFCTSEAVESETNVTQRLAKKGDVYDEDVDKLLLNLLKLGTCRASFVPNWCLTKAVSSGLNYINLPAVSTQSREKAAAPGPEISMIAHECVRGVSAEAQRLWVAEKVELEERAMSITAALPSTIWSQYLHAKTVSMLPGVFLLGTV